MATYRSIATTETDPQAPITSSLMKALDANTTSAFEGDSTAVAAGVTLKDTALDTGAATAAGIAWVGLRSAGLATGAVGSYAFLNNQATPASTTNIAAGTAVAGSGLTYSNASGNNVGGAPAGTWKSMGWHQTGPVGTIPLISAARTTLFLRIA